MVYCFNCELAFSTAARRDTVFDGLLAGVTSQLRFGAEQFEKRSGKLGANGINIIMRFRDRLDCTAFRDLLESLCTTTTPRAGSWYRIHDCTHDEGGSCGEGTRRVF